MWERQLTQLVQYSNGVQHTQSGRGHSAPSASRSHILLCSVSLHLPSTEKNTQRSYVSVHSLTRRCESSPRVFNGVLLLGDTSCSATQWSFSRSPCRTKDDIRHPHLPENHLYFIKPNTYLLQCIPCACSCLILPSKYEPGRTLLSFQVQTRLGVLWVVWPQTHLILCSLCSWLGCSLCVHLPHDPEPQWCQPWAQ